jgi:hypothetical protein
MYVIVLMVDNPEEGASDALPPAIRQRRVQC